MKKTLLLAISLFFSFPQAMANIESLPFAQEPIWDLQQDYEKLEEEGIAVLEEEIEEEEDVFVSDGLG